MVTRQEPTAATLANLYRVIWENVRDCECYYTKKEIEELKKDKTSHFLRKETKCH